MRLILYRLRSLLREQWGAALALTVVVAVAGGLVLTLAASAARTLSASDRYVATHGRDFDVVVEQQGGPPNPARLEELPSVKSVRTATFVFGALFAEGESAPAEALVFAGSHEAFGVRMIDGREPDPSEPDEFSASQSFVESSGVRLGDRFTLVTISKEQAAESGFDVEEPAGPAVTARLVGVFTGPTELQDGYATALFPPALLDGRDIGISASMNAVALEGDATIADLRRELDVLPDAAGFGIDSVDLVPAPERDAVNARGQGVAVVAGILALAVVAVVGQLLGRQVRLADAEAFALSAVGMTPRQLIADPVGRAAVPVVIGALVASAIAIAASGLVPLGFVASVEPDPGLRLEPIVHLLGPVVLAAALLVWVVVAISWGDRRARQRTPSRFVEWVALRARPLQAATAVRFSFTHQARDSGSPGAYVGLVLVLAALIAALTFGASLGRVIDEPARYGSADLSIGGQGGEEAIGEEVIAQLADAPEVSALVLEGTVVVSVGSTSVDITGLDPVVGDLRPPLLAGRLPAGDDEVALGSVTAHDLALEVGDQMVLVGASGQRSLRVTGLAVVPGVEGGDGAGLGGVVTFEGLRQIDSSAAATTLAVELQPDAPADAVERLAELTGSAIGPSSPPAAVISFGRVRTLPFVVAATLGLLGVLNLTHQLIVSARDRRRDVAILGALGASRRWVSSVVHWQATISAVVVMAFAIPLGFVGGSLIFRAFVDRVGVVNEATLPPWMLVVALVGIVALANLVATVPARRVRHQTLARVLGDE